MPTNPKLTERRARDVSNFDTPSNVGRNQFGGRQCMEDREFAENMGKASVLPRIISRVEKQAQELAQIPEDTKLTFFTQPMLKKRWLQMNSVAAHAKVSRAFEVLEAGLDGSFACPACGERNIAKVSPTQLSAAQMIIDRFHGKSDSKSIVRISNQELVYTLLGAVKDFFNPTAEQFEDFTLHLGEILDLSK